MEKWINQQLNDNYDYVGHESNGYIQVGLDEKYGFVDARTGELAVELKYDEVWDFNGDGVAIVELDGKQGVIDTQSNLITQIEFDEVDNFEDGLARIELDGKYGFIDKYGTKIAEPIYDDVEILDEGFIKIEDNGDYGLISMDGKKILEPIYSDIEILEDNFIQVELDGNYGLYNEEGREIIAAIYSEIEMFDDGLIKVEMDEEAYGLFNTEGKEIVPAIYDDVELIDDDFIKLEKDDKYGLIDNNGKVIIELKYDSIESFGDDDYAEAELNGNTFYFDKEGQAYIHDGEEYFKISFNVEKKPKSKDLQLLVDKYVNNEISLEEYKAESKQLLAKITTQEGLDEFEVHLKKIKAVIERKAQIAETIDLLN